MSTDARPNTRFVIMLPAMEYAADTRPMFVSQWLDTEPSFTYNLGEALKYPDGRDAPLRLILNRLRTHGTVLHPRVLRLVIRQVEEVPATWRVLGE